MQQRTATISFPLAYSLLMHILVASFLLTLPIYSSGAGARSLAEYFVFLRSGEGQSRTAADMGSQVNGSAAVNASGTSGHEPDGQEERPATEEGKTVSPKSAVPEGRVQETVQTDESSAADETPAAVSVEEKSPKKDIIMAVEGERPVAEEKKNISSKPAVTEAPPVQAIAQARESSASGKAPAAVSVEEKSLEKDVVIAVEDVKKKQEKMNDEHQKDVPTVSAQETVSVPAAPAGPSISSTKAPVSIFKSAELSPEIAASPPPAEVRDEENLIRAGQAGQKDRLPLTSSKTEVEKSSPGNMTPAVHHENSTKAGKQGDEAKPTLPDTDIAEKNAASKKVPDTAGKKDIKLAAVAEHLSPARTTGGEMHPSERPTVPAPLVPHAAVPPAGPATGHSMPDAAGRVDKAKEKTAVNGVSRVNAAVGEVKQSAIGISGAAALIPRDVRIEVMLSGKETSAVSIHLFLRSYPSSKMIVREKDRAADAEEEDDGQARARRIFSIVNAHKGVYTLVIGNDGKEDCIAGAVFLFFEGTPKERKKGYRAVQLPPGTAARFKFLLPDAVFWDDEDRFTGSTEDSDSITKFNSDTGLVWREEKDY